MADRYTARRLPRDPGPSGWLEIIGEVPAYPQLEDGITADVVVIGAGFTGLSAARRLADNDPSLSVVVLEAGHVAAGPAGRNSGFMIDLPHDLGGDSYVSNIDHDRKQITLNRKAQDFARAMAAEYAMPEEAVDPCGRINGAADRSGQNHNLEYTTHLDKLGESYTILSADDMERITGTPFYAGGLYMPGTIMLQPALYITRLARGMTTTLANRVSLYERTPALEMQRNGSGWIVQTPKGSVTAGTVIMAVNGHAESFGFYKKRLMHVFTYASMTRELDQDSMNAIGGELKWNITPSDPMGTTIRRINGVGGNRIVVRNRWSFDSSMEVTEGRVKRFARSHRESFRKRFPQLEGIDFPYQWAGRLCLSLNSVPAFGMVDTNLVSACCQNGLGTAKGTLAGMASADLVTGHRTDIVREMESGEDPKKLPPWPISSIGANSVIKFREFKARKEL